MPFISPAVLKERTAKLPLWAKSHIQSLQRQVDALKKQSAGIKGEENSGVKATYTESGQDIYLPERATISFDLSNDICVTASLRNHGKMKSVDIYTSYQSVILPESSNHFQIISSYNLNKVVR
jgi:hypothetical protein